MPFEKDVWQLWFQKQAFKDKIWSFLGEKIVVPKPLPHLEKLVYVVVKEKK